MGNQVYKYLISENRGNSTCKKIVDLQLPERSILHTCILF